MGGGRETGEETSEKKCRHVRRKKLQALKSKTSYNSNNSTAKVLLSVAWLQCVTYPSTHLWGIYSVTLSLFDLYHCKKNDNSTSSTSYRILLSKPWCIVAGPRILVI